MTDLDPEARRVLSLARAARTPSAADKRRVQRRLALSAAASVAAGSGAAVAHAAEGASAVKAAGLFTSLKLYVAGGALLLSAAGGYALLSPPKAATPGSPPIAAGAPTRPVAPAPVAPAATSEPVAAPAPPRAAPHRAPRTADLARELDLLHSAQEAWRSRDSEKTLSLLEQHSRQYPRSELRYERTALRVLALCELGRTGEARRLARALIRRAPNSPVRTTIEESCAIP